MIKAAESAVTKNSGQIRILVAEDDKFLSKVLSDKLRRRGFEVLLASDGTEAVNRIKENNLDLVLLDLVMPNKDGFEVLSDIKSDPAFKNLAIVVLSNLGQEKDIVEAKRLGALDYLVKSNLSLDEVVIKINSVVAGKKISKIKAG